MDAAKPSVNGPVLCHCYLLGLADPWRSSIQTMPQKQQQYDALVAMRKKCRRCVGLANPASKQLYRLDSKEIGPWSRLHGDLDVGILGHVRVGQRLDRLTGKLAAGYGKFLEGRHAEWHHGRQRHRRRTVPFQIAVFDRQVLPPGGRRRRSTIP